MSTPTDRQQRWLLIAACSASVVIAVVTLTVGLGVALILCGALAVIVLGYLAVLAAAAMTDPLRLLKEEERERSRRDRG